MWASCRAEVKNRMWAEDLWWAEGIVSAPASATDMICVWWRVCVGKLKSEMKSHKSATPLASAGHKGMLVCSWVMWLHNNWILQRLSEHYCTFRTLSAMSAIGIIRSFISSFFFFCKSMCRVTYNAVSYVRVHFLTHLLITELHSWVNYWSWILSAAYTHLCTWVIRWSKAAYTAHCILAWPCPL